MHVLTVYSPLELLSISSQKHAPSGIIELKEMRTVSEVQPDGTFNVSLFDHFGADLDLLVY